MDKIVDTKILDLFNERDLILNNILDNSNLLLKNKNIDFQSEEFILSISNISKNAYKLIEIDSNIINKIGDYDLYLKYYNLNNFIKSEKYEEASIIKNEILNYEF